MHKKVLFVLLATVFTASSAMAKVGTTNAAGEKAMIGIRAGYNRSNYVGSDAPNSMQKPGIQLGLIWGNYLPKSTMFSSHMGLLFSQFGAKVNDRIDGVKLNAEMTLNYLQIPINFRYNLHLGSGMGLYAQAGIYSGYALWGRQKSEVRGEWESKKINFKDRNISTYDFGLGLGAGLLVMNRVELGIVFDRGLFSQVTNSIRWMHFYNSNLAITATFLF